jgi:predicted DNA-binding transcriptional regulator AlpA
VLGFEPSIVNWCRGYFSGNCCGAMLSIPQRFKMMNPHEYSELRQASAGGPAGGDEVLLTAQQVCARLGGISTMTLWRWLSSDAVRFPQPTVRLNKRRYWQAGSIRRWLAERSSESRITEPQANDVLPADAQSGNARQPNFEGEAYERETV